MWVPTLGTSVWHMSTPTSISLLGYRPIHHLIFSLYFLYMQLCLDSQTLIIVLALPTVFSTVTCHTGLEHENNRLAYTALMGSRPYHLDLSKYILWCLPPVLRGYMAAILVHLITAYIPKLVHKCPGKLACLWLFPVGNLQIIQKLSHRPHHMSRGYTRSLSA